MEKPRSGSKRERIRTAFHAAAAAASVLGGAAQADELKLPPGVNAVNRTISERVHHAADTKLPRIVVNEGMPSPEEVLKAESAWLQRYC